MAKPEWMRTVKHIVSSSKGIIKPPRILRYFYTFLGIAALALFIGFGRTPTRADVKAVSWPIDETPTQRSIFLLVFNPIIESAGNVKLSQYRQWNDPDQLTNALIPLFPQMSNSYVSYVISERQEVDGYYVKPSGYQFTDESYLACVNGTGPCNSEIINYQQLFADYNICTKNVDEVWLWGAPYFGYWEYNPVSYCGKTTFVMGFSYERGMGEALHDFGHRMEYVGINRVGDGNWQQNEATEWNKFSLIAGHCGNIHYPPGTIVGSEEYKYDKSTPVDSDCDGYLSYPSGPFPVESLTCSAWGCSQQGYVQWWLTHIPHNPGTTIVGGKTLYNNWWKYYVHFDETYEPAPIPAPGVFSGLSATLPIPGNAVFNFSYSGTPPTNYVVDLSTYADMSWDVYVTFAQGPASPITEPNPTKWVAYSCGRSLYWRVRTPSGVLSDIQSATVTCTTPTPTPSPTPTPTPTPMPTATPTPETLLKNGDFELDTNGNTKPDSWSSNSHFTRSAIVVRDGSFSGRHYSSSNSGYTISQKVPSLVPGNAYRFSGWVNIPPTSDAFTFRIQIDWYSQSGTLLSKSILHTFTAVTSGWEQVASSVVAPAGTSYAKVKMYTSSFKATAFVDTFRFTQ